MKIAYFDTIAGVSGDMTLGAFISAGVSFDQLKTELGKLNLPGTELTAAHVQRNGITATKVDVIISAPQKHHRHLKDILAMVEACSLSESVKENARKIFGEIARAEAKVHNTDVEKVHFHEVGALDSIIDIVGTSICLELLGNERVYSSPVKVGQGGFVGTEHGQLPIPAPATMEILRGYPVILTDTSFELTTPTGAAIIKAMSSGVLAKEAFVVSGIGYGAGTRDLSPLPNVLRIMVGEMTPVAGEEEVVILETNIDDMNPELYPYAIEKLLAGGALDAYLTPVIMKKGRPGILLSVLTLEKNIEKILEVLFSQTSTIGVRILRTQRRTMGRESREVKTKLGIVKVKAVVHEGKVRLVPEYEECRKLAEQTNLPLLEVYRILEAELQR